MKRLMLSALACAALLSLGGSPARAESPNWRTASAAFETMRQEKKPGVFWFHGDTLFHNSLCHKFHQKPVVDVLRRFYCVQIPKEGGRSFVEQPIAKRFGIGATMGVIVVCYWDGEEMTRYGDIVETRHFVPIVKEWYAANAKRLKETEKARKALARARKHLASGKTGVGVLKVTQVLAKEGKITSSVIEEARVLEAELLAQAEQGLREAAGLMAHDPGAGKDKAEAIRRDYKHLGDIKDRATALIDGEGYLPGRARVAPGASVRGPTLLKRGDGQVDVTFRYRGNPGERVTVAGSFNGWNAHASPLQDADGDGVFELTLPLGARKHQYKFVVGGSRWLVDPDNPRSESDGRGNTNSVLDASGM